MIGGIVPPILKTMLTKGQKISLKLKGRRLSPKSEFKVGQPSPLKGKKNPKGSLAKRGSGNPNYGKFREKNPNWRGGSAIQDLRKTQEYVQWRLAIFDRDGFACQGCREIGGRLEAHHIQKWADYPELRFELSNGITLCRDCHKKTENYGTKK